MEWRRFGTDRIGSSNIGSKILRLIRGLRNGDVGISSPGLESETRERSGFNVQAYIVGKQRMHEIENEKAMLISVSRHERWKAGGPV